MDHLNEPTEGMPDMPIANDAPESADSPAYGLPTPPGDDQTAGISADSGVPRFAPPPSQVPPPIQVPPPHFAAAPIHRSSPRGAGQDSYYGQPLPAAPRRRKMVVIIAIVSFTVALLGTVLARVLTGPAGSTLDVRVVVPAPTSAGGLSRDFAGESSVQFQVGLAAFAQELASAWHQHVSSYATALYTNAPAGRPATSASVAVLYVGFNTAGEPLDPASAVNEAIGGLRVALRGTTSHGVNSAVERVSGLPGDTSAACVDRVANGVPVAACVWATDKTVSIIASLIPASDNELASVLRKIRPALIRG